MDTRKKLDIAHSLLFAVGVLLHVYESGFNRGLKERDTDSD